MKTQGGHWKSVRAPDNGLSHRETWQDPVKTTQKVAGEPVSRILRSLFFIPFESYTYTKQRTCGVSVVSVVSVARLAGTRWAHGADGLESGCVSGGWLQRVSACRVLGRGSRTRVTASAGGHYVLTFPDGLDFSLVSRRCELKTRRKKPRGARAIAEAPKEALRSLSKYEAKTA